MAEEIKKWELYFNPTRFQIFEHEGKFWIESYDDGSQAELLIDYIKQVMIDGKHPLV